MEKIRFVFVLPPGMFFSKSKAGSIELCTHDLATSHHFKMSSTVIGPTVIDPLSDNFIGIASGSEKSFENQLTDLIKHINPEMVIINQQFRIASRLKKKFMSIKFLVYRHNHVKKRSGLSKIWMNIYLKPIDHFLFCSDYIRDEFSKIFPSYKHKSSTLYNAVDVDIWNPKIKRENVILFIGRPTDDKGLIEFLQAGEQILNEFAGWTLKIIISHAHLDREYANYVKKIIDHHDKMMLCENVEYSEIIRECETAGIMVVPSKWTEPFGRTAIEALSGGAALISSGKGGLAEASEDAALYLNSISKEEIYCKIKQLIENPELAENIRQKGYELIKKKFSQKIVYANLAKFFQLLLNKN